MTGASFGLASKPVSNTRHEDSAPDEPLTGLFPPGI